MTKPYNNQPLIRVYTHKNVINMCAYRQLIFKTILNSFMKICVK